LPIDCANRSRWRGIIPCGQTVRRRNLTGSKDETASDRQPRRAITMQNVAIRRCGADQNFKVIGLMVTLRNGYVITRISFSSSSCLSSSGMTAED